VLYEVEQVRVMEVSNLLLLQHSLGHKTVRSHKPNSIQYCLVKKMTGAQKVKQYIVRNPNFLKKTVKDLIQSHMNSGLFLIPYYPHVYAAIS
jgi:hypothetical protein